MTAITSTPIPCTLLRGDGIGPEIVEATLLVLDALRAPYDWHDKPAGLGAFERYGDPLPDDTLADIQQTRLALKGPLTTPIGGGFRSINVRLREALKLYANVRPGRTLLPDGKFQDVDIVLIRENTGGFYVGVEHFIQIGDDPHAVAEATRPFNLEDLRHAANIPWSQAAVAFAFLKERSVVLPAGGRNHAAAGATPYEDAMVEFHALREKGPSA